MKRVKGQVIYRDCMDQNAKFRLWAKSRKWNVFHSSHYDWWAFPIDQPSGSHGTAYQVTEKQLHSLAVLPDFIEALRQNAILVCEAWGWDLKAGKYLDKSDSDQKWTRWPIRLSKMCRSLEIFQQRDLLLNAIKFGVILLKDFKKFTFGGKDLTPYFYEKAQELNIMPIKAKKEQGQKKQERVPIWKRKQSSEIQVNNGDKTQNKRGISCCDCDCKDWKSEKEYQLQQSFHKKNNGNEYQLEKYSESKWLQNKDQFGRDIQPMKYNVPIEDKIMRQSKQQIRRKQQSTNHYNRNTKQFDPQNPHTLTNNKNYPSSLVRQKQQQPLQKHYYGTTNQNPNRLYKQSRI